MCISFNIYKMDVVIASFECIYSILIYIIDIYDILNISKLYKIKSVFSMIIFYKKWTILCEKYSNNVLKMPT